MFNPMIINAAYILVIIPLLVIIMELVRRSIVGIIAYTIDAFCHAIYAEVPTKHTRGVLRQMWTSK